MGLKTEREAARVGRAAVAAFKSTGNAHAAVAAVFEHGHWWLSCPTCGAQWDVVDATGPGALRGFGFEQVSDGDGYCEGGG